MESSHRKCWASFARGAESVFCLDAAVHGPLPACVSCCPSLGNGSNFSQARGPDHSHPLPCRLPGPPRTEVGRGSALGLSLPNPLGSFSFPHWESSSDQEAAWTHVAQETSPCNPGHPISLLWADQARERSLGCGKLNSLFVLKTSFCFFPVSKSSWQRCRGARSG